MTQQFALPVVEEPGVIELAVVFDHLYTPGDIVEVACWCHLRRYFGSGLVSACSSSPPAWRKPSFWRDKK